MSKNKNQSQQPQQKQPAEKAGEYSIKDYIIINAVFWAFLLVIAVIVFITAGGKWDPIMSNVFSFIFLVFGCGFTAVSVFDYVYEKAAKKNEVKQ
jgi:uncharacterized membrane protein